MKKLAVASAVLAVMASSAAFANVSLDVYSERVTDTSAEQGFFGESEGKQGFVLGYSPMSGLDLDAEVTTAKDLDLGVAYTIEMGNFYVKPQAGYVYKWNKAEDKKLDENGEYDLTLYGADQNVAKLGLETGAAFGDFFTSVRYRLETNLGKTGTRVQNGSAVALDKSSTSQIGRTDLLLGYSFDAVTFTAKGIHRSELDKNIRHLNSEILNKQNSGWNSEFKATLTSFDAIAPYVQLAHNHNSHDNTVKLGAKFAF